MNLETFKARARRKLELPHGGYSNVADRPQEGPEPTNAPANAPAAREPEPAESPTSSSEQPSKSMTPREPTSAAPKDSLTSTDKFAQAMSHARGSNDADRSTQDLPAVEDVRVDRRASGPTSVHALTGSPASTTTDTTQTTADSQLNHLRALLLGDAYDNQQDQVEVVYQRTQAGINALRRDMDGRLNDLTEYIEQLEQSILNSIETRTEQPEGEAWALVENTAERLNQHEQRLDSLDVRLTNTLTNLRQELEENRQADRQFLQGELTAANARTDKLIVGVSQRFEESLKSMETKLSEQLNTQSAGLIAESETTVASLRDQLASLIDDRIKSFNAEQSSGLVALRDTLLANTKAINDELKLQTNAQQETLGRHRSQLETQFNAAIETLTTSKVSHKELSQLLSRLADLIAQS